MSLDESWTPEQQAVINAAPDSPNAQNLRKVLRVAAQDNLPQRVTVEECRSYRECVRSGEATAQELGDSPDTRWKYSSVKDHVFGHCNHDEGVVGPAVDTVPGSAPKVTQFQCYEINDLRQRGLSAHEIVKALGHPTGTVCYHLDRCSHDKPNRWSGDS